MYSVTWTRFFLKKPMDTVSIEATTALIWAIVNIWFPQKLSWIDMSELTNNKRVGSLEWALVLSCLGILTYYCSLSMSPDKRYAKMYALILTLCVTAITLERSGDGPEPLAFALIHCAFLLACVVFSSCLPWFLIPSDLLQVLKCWCLCVTSWVWIGIGGFVFYGHPCCQASETTVLIDKTFFYFQLFSFTIVSVMAVIQVTGNCSNKKVY